MAEVRAGQSASRRKGLCSANPRHSSPTTLSTGIASTMPCASLCKPHLSQIACMIASFSSLRARINTAFLLLPDAESHCRSVSCPDAAAVQNRSARRARRSGGSHNVLAVSLIDQRDDHLIFVLPHVDFFPVHDAFADLLDHLQHSPIRAAQRYRKRDAASGCAEPHCA